MEMSLLKKLEIKAIGQAYLGILNMSSTELFLLY